MRKRGKERATKTGSESKAKRKRKGDFEGKRKGNRIPEKAFREKGLGWREEDGKEEQKRQGQERAGGRSEHRTHKSSHELPRSTSSTSHHLDLAVHPASDAREEHHAELKFPPFLMKHRNLNTPFRKERHMTPWFESG